MIEFFKMVWAWITDNAGIIAGILTPANLALLVGAMVSLFRQKRTIISNTNVAGELSKALKESAILPELKRVSKETSSLKALVEDLSDQMGQAIAKLNAVLEVQESAYNASKLPDETRVAIRNFIASGKFAESKARVAINDEMAALKAQIADLMANSEVTSANIQKFTNVSKDKPSGVRL